MNFGRRFTFPEEQWEERKRAKRLSWISIAALTSTAVLMYLTLGQSEAMKTAWIEDLLGMIPPIVLLIALRIETRRPNKRFPYGYFVRYQSLSSPLRRCSPSRGCGCCWMP